MQSIPLKCAKRSIILNCSRRLPVIHYKLDRGLRTSATVSGTTPNQPTVDHGYLPNSSSPITTNLEFFDAVSEKAIPAYRVLDGNGEILDGATVPEVCLL
jgi:hypothetical protein